MKKIILGFSLSLISSYCFAKYVGVYKVAYNNQDGSIVSICIPSSDTEYLTVQSTISIIMITGEQLNSLVENGSDLKKIKVNTLTKKISNKSVQDIQNIEDQRQFKKDLLNREELSKRLLSINDALVNSQSNVVKQYYEGEKIKLEAEINAIDSKY